MRIAIDLDGVLVDFLTPAGEIIKQETGYDIREILYDLKHPLYEMIDTMLSVIANNNIDYTKLLSYEGALELVKELFAQNDFNIVYLTSRSNNQDNATYKWLLDNGFPLLPIIFNRDKGIYCRDFEVDLLIEDQVKYALQVLEDAPKTQCFLIERYWNNYEFESKRVKRLHCYEDILFYTLFFRPAKD